MEIGEYFYGNALGVVDAKGRTSLPSSYRAVAETRARLHYVPGSPFPEKEVLIGEHPRHPCLQGYDPTFQPILFQRLQAKAEAAGGDVMDALDDLQLESFSVTESIGYDPAGRFVLPATLREIAGIDPGGQALFMAAGETFQIWNPDRFRAAFFDKPRLIRALDALLKARK